MRPTPGWVWRRRAISARHLVAGELAALAGLGALGHLDLQLVGVGQVLGRDAEAARGDLLDLRVLVVAALAPGAVAVRGPRRPRRSWTWPPSRFIACGQRLVGLLRQGAVRHGPGREPPGDVGRRLDLVDRRRGRPPGASSSRSCSSIERPVVDQLGERVVALGRLGPDGRLEQVGDEHVAVLPVVAGLLDERQVVERLRRCPCPWCAARRPCGPGRSRATRGRRWRPRPPRAGRARPRRAPSQPMPPTTRACR